MIIKRVTPKSYPLDFDNVKQVSNVTFIWASDGWCYIPELKKRRRYILTDDNDIMMLVEEPWEGIVPPPLSLEKVKLSLFSESFPQVWMEESGAFSELYVEQTTIQNKNKKPRVR